MRDQKVPFQNWSHRVLNRHHFFEIRHHIFSVNDESRNSGQTHPYFSQIDFGAASWFGTDHDFVSVKKLFFQVVYGVQFSADNNWKLEHGPKVQYLRFPYGQVGGEPSPRKSLDRDFGEFWHGFGERVVEAGSANVLFVDDE